MRAMQVARHSYHPSDRAKQAQTLLALAYDFARGHRKPSRSRRPGTCETARESRGQLDFFVPTPEARGPLVGLLVSLPDACKCGADTTRVGPPVGPHLAELRCTRCERHRGWLPRAAHQFLVEAVNKFGRPPEPIAIRRGGQQREQA